MIRFRVPVSEFIKVLDHLFYTFDKLFSISSTRIPGRRDNLLESLVINGSITNCRQSFLSVLQLKCKKKKN